MDYTIDCKNSNQKASELIKKKADTDVKISFDKASGKMHIQSDEPLSDIQVLRIGKLLWDFDYIE